MKIKTKGFSVIEFVMIVVVLDHCWYICLFCFAEQKSRCYRNQYYYHNLRGKRCHGHTGQCARCHKLRKANSNRCRVKIQCRIQVSLYSIKC